MTPAITHGVWSVSVIQHLRSKQAHSLEEAKHPLYPRTDTQLLTTSLFQETLPELSVRLLGTAQDTVLLRLTGSVLEQTVSITSTVPVPRTLVVTLVTTMHTKPLLTSGLVLL